jgi:hypothetical protein
MIRARLGALIAVAALLVAAAAFALSRTREAPTQARHTLLLLTGLPLIFGEDFSLEGGGSPALAALQARYRVVPISVTDGADLRKGRLLLMAHPIAQTAENLVTLDAWVRAGGRVLLLADPMLEWPSKRPLGDPLRPPPMFMDTGLLAHWGLRLDAPDQRGRQVRKLAGRDVLTVSPGSLAGRCQISGDRLVARCKVGKGRATVVADADLIDTADLGQEASGNLDALLAELAKLEED